MLQDGIWNEDKYDSFEWQLSPPETPHVYPTHVSVNAVNIEFGSISVSGDNSSISAVAAQTSEDVVFDRLSWNLGLWSKSSWQTSPPEFPELSVFDISVTTFDNADTSIIPSRSLASINVLSETSTETEDLSVGRWETRSWGRFDWTGGTRRDPGTLTQVSASAFSTEDNAVASDVSIVSSSAAPIQAASVSSVDDGVADVVSDVTSSTFGVSANTLTDETNITSRISQSSVTPTNDIEVTSAISIVSPQTSDVSTLAVGDEQTFAGDVASLAQPLGIPQSLDADTESVDIPILAAMSAETQISTDASSASDLGATQLSANVQPASMSITPVAAISLGNIISQSSIDVSISSDDSFTETATASLKPADAVTVSDEENIVSSISVTTGGATETSSAEDNRVVTTVSVSTTIPIIQLGINNVVQESTTATPIVPTDEETSALEGGALSILRGDNIVTNADTRAADTPNIETASATTTQPFVTLGVNDTPTPETVTTTTTTTAESILLLPLHVTAVVVEQQEALGSLEIASALSPVTPSVSTAFPIIVEDEDTASLEEGVITHTTAVSIALTSVTETVVQKDEQTGGTLSDSDTKTSKVSFVDTATSQAITESQTSSVITDGA